MAICSPLAMRSEISCSTIFSPRATEACSKSTKLARSELITKSLKLTESAAVVTTWNPLKLETLPWRLALGTSTCRPADRIPPYCHHEGGFCPRDLLLALKGCYLGLRARTRADENDSCGLAHGLQFFAHGPRSERGCGRRKPGASLRGELQPVKIGVMRKRIATINNGSC